MLKLINETNHEAELSRLILDDHNGVAVVVVKSTYDVERGRARRIALDVRASSKASYAGAAGGKSVTPRGNGWAPNA